MDRQLNLHERVHRPDGTERAQVHQRIPKGESRNVAHQSSNIDAGPVDVNLERFLKGWAHTPRAAAHSPAPKARQTGLGGNNSTYLSPCLVAFILRGADDSLANSSSLAAGGQ